MIFLTEIQAIDPFTHELCTWCGPRIEADNEREAQNYCLSNGLGYCKVIGELKDEKDAQLICPN